MGGQKASALGRTPAGPVNAAAAVAMFMGTGAGAGGAAPGAKNAGGKQAGGRAGGRAGGQAGGQAGGRQGGNNKRQLLDALTGGLGGGKGGGKGTKTPKGTVEGGVAAGAGTGATSGLPTTADDGTISMTFHQVNQDGAGPLKAMIDATSGGTDPAAFQNAQVTQNVPGAVAGLSLVSTTDFPVKVQMPPGMQCTGTVAGVQNVCVVRMANSAVAGPFGGSAAFTQSTGAQKRAVEYNLRKRHFARGILGKPE